MELLAAVLSISSRSILKDRGRLVTLNDCGVRLELPTPIAAPIERRTMPSASRRCFCDVRKDFWKANWTAKMETGWLAVVAHFKTQILGQIFKNLTKL